MKWYNTFAILLGFIVLIGGIIAAGVNADLSEERIKVACIESGGSIIENPNSSDFNCVVE